MTAHTTAAMASAAAGLLWITAWLHLLMAHGVTEVNERKLVFGLTWLDSGRLIAPSLFLAAATVWLLAASSGRSILRIAASVATIGLTVAFVGVILGFWTQPFGTYDGASREHGLAAVGGALAMVGSVLMAPGLAFFAVVTARAALIPGWLAGLLVVGALLAVPWLYESLQGVIFGIAWLALGAVLIADRRRTPIVGPL